jgi:hypothetical protein
VVFAAFHDTPYKIVFLLHIFAVIVAFAPAFIWPLIGRHRALGDTGAPGAATSGLATPEAPAGVTSPLVSRVLNPLVHGGALVLAGLFGIALIGMAGNDLFKFSQSWISIAFLLWFLMLAVLFAGLYPAERRLSDPDLSHDRRIALVQRLSMLYGMLHLLLLLQLIDMIFKPGGPGV